MCNIILWAITHFPLNRQEDAGVAAAHARFADDDKAGVTDSTMDQGAGADPNSSAFMNPIFSQVLDLYRQNDVVSKLEAILLYEPRTLVEAISGDRPSVRSAVQFS